MINFLKYRLIYFTISFFILTIGVYSILKYGFSFSIDFAGGSLIEYRFKKNTVSFKLIKEVFESHKIKIYSFKNLNENSVFIKTTPINEKLEKEIRKKIEEKSKTKIQLLRLEIIGPVLGKEMFRKTIYAIIAAVFGILLYLSFAFRNFNYGISAVLAMIHDFLVLLGSNAFLGKFLGAEFDPLFVTALLTTMSFSVHDTIVVFDKIREYQKTESQRNFRLIANQALSETMVRSINNSLTIILMLLAFLLFGSEPIRFFVVFLLIGTITGTYSSPFVAVPLLEILENTRTKTKNFSDKTGNKI